MIVQVLDYYASGNAVANIAVSFYQFTKKMGMQAKIVARLIDKHDDIIDNIDVLETLSQNDIIMYHMCIGTPLNDEICRYKTRKILVYHNITPPDLIKGYDCNLAEACEEGLLQLRWMARTFEYAIADSEFNKNDLVEAGYDPKKIAVIPPLIRREDFERTPNSKTLKKYQDGKINFLFVGRISPNKKQEDLIRFFDYYKKEVDSNSRLILAGGGGGKYIEDLKRYVKKLDLTDVVFTGQISFDELLAIYASAAFFICTSEHEGYGMPLVEAMLFDIPVIGYDVAAVGDTMGKGGVLIDNKNPVYIAKVVQHIQNDERLKKIILQGQREQLECLKENCIYETFKQTVDQWLKNKMDVEEEKEFEADRYDVVLTIKAEDWQSARINIDYVKRNLNPKKIVVISSKRIRRYLDPLDLSIEFVDEDNLYPELSYETVKNILEQMGQNGRLAGWYLQQFLKYAYAFSTKDQFYLTWDADTIPLNPISMYDKEANKPIFDMKPEYVEAYFATIDNLFKYEKKVPESFISEHMLFDSRIVKQMIEEIEHNKWLKGKSFFEKILRATAFDVRPQAFSEFETYGTYCEYNYPQYYKKRHLRTFRAGKMFLGDRPSREILDWVGKCIDTISFEYPQKPIIRSVAMANKKKFREKYSFNQLVRRVNTIDKLAHVDYLDEENAALRMDYPYANEY